MKKITLSVERCDFNPTAWKVTKAASQVIQSLTLRQSDALEKCVDESASNPEPDAY